MIVPNSHFRGSFTASILTLLGTSSTDDDVQHEPAKEWLLAKSEEIVNKCIARETGTDPAYTLHCLFMHHVFLYVDLREAIRWENGPVIVQHWKSWIPLFLATGYKNYACEAVYHISNLTAGFPKHMAYVAIHNRTVNTSGKPGKGKPMDQLIEHYNP